jgi:hypothetical protein
MLLKVALNTITLTLTQDDKMVTFQLIKELKINRSDTSPQKTREV